MTYTLKFEPWSDTSGDSLVNFVLLYQAFLGTADNPNRARSLEETRMAIKILDKLAKISDVKNANTTSETRMLKPGGGELVLEKPEHDLLKRCVDTYVGSVPFGMARSAIEMKDFLDGASESKD